MLLRGTEADVVAPGDVAGMATVLRRRIEQYRRGERPPCLAADGRFSRGRQAQILFEAIARCVDGGGPS